MRFSASNVGGTWGACVLASAGTTLGLGWGQAITAAADAESPAGANFHKLDALDGAELKLVQVVFRHGARTPLTTHTDFWKHSPTWDYCKPVPFKPVPLTVTSTDGVVNPANKENTHQMSRALPGGCFAGELTIVGHNQAHSVGRWMRERYVGNGYLPKDYEDGVVQSRTTNYDRTVKTLQGVLTGLYPEGAPNGGTIPVTTSGDLDEILIADTRSCPNLQTYLKMFKTSVGVTTRRDPEFSWAYAELKRVLDLDDEFFKKHTWPMTEIHDAMTSMRTHGKSLPDGMTDRLIAVVNRLATKEFSSLLAPSIRDENGRTMIRLSMGVLLDTLVGNMEKVVDASGEEKSPKVFLYSGHDSTVLPLLAALGLEMSEWPPYMSNIVFELWKLPDASGQHVVRVLFNERELQIPHCPIGEVATLKTFKEEVVGPFVIPREAWGDACHMKMTHADPAPHPASMSSLVGDEE